MAKKKAATKAKAKSADKFAKEYDEWARGPVKKPRASKKPAIDPEKSRKLGELMAKIHKILSAA